MEWASTSLPHANSAATSYERASVRSDCTPLRSMKARAARILSSSSLEARWEEMRSISTRPSERSSESSACVSVQGPEASHRSPDARATDTTGVRRATTSTY